MTAAAVRAPRLPTQDELEEIACRQHLGVWSERRRGYRNAPVHWEWSELAMTRSRLCVVAPREHAKTETFTVNQCAWRIIYQPGIWCYVFAATDDVAKALKARIDTAVQALHPWLLDRARTNNVRQTVYGNYSRLDAAGAGKAVRSNHPDVIVGDDVLEEAKTMTELQRRATHRWWFGSVANMAHPRTTRTLPNGVVIDVPATVIHLVGTPFHKKDLLLGMATNPIYVFRRYAAEFHAADLVPGTLALEATDVRR